MNKFTNLTSHITPLNLDNVDTDMIIPAQHLKSVSKEGYGENVFSALRSLYPDFVLNKSQYAAGKILVSKDNFGCGSSREHAVWAIQQYGIQTVICSSFSDIFFNNSAKNGLLLIIQPLELIEEWLNLAENQPDLAMTINLEQQTILYNGQNYHFNYDGFRKHCLINGLDDLDFLLSHNNEINRYEKKHCSTCR